MSVPLVFGGYFSIAIFHHSARHLGGELDRLLHHRHGDGIFHVIPGIAPEWRLFIATGFCGGLTTFSTFSVEIVALLQSGRMAYAFGAVALHLFGSLAMTFAGIATVSLA